MTEDTPLQPKAPKQPSATEGVQAWRCCTALAAVEVPALERHRQRLLFACLAMAVAGVALSAAGFFGGYSESRAVVTRLPWIVGQLAESGKQFHGGVTHVCADRAGREAVAATAWLQLRERSGQPPGPAPAHQAGCYSWSHDAVCKARGAATVPCEACKDASVEIGVAVGIALATYVSFSLKTYQRWKGEDSNLNKFISSVLTIIGAFNFLFALWTFDTTCIKVAERFDGIDMRAGLGYKCLVLATLLKVPMGALHMALPVRPRGTPRLTPEGGGGAC